jgi:hypothetical protein
VRLQYLEHGQMEAERTVQQHQVHIFLDTILKSYEYVANADFHQLGQTRSRKVFAGALAFVGSSSVSMR